MSDLHNFSYSLDEIIKTMQETVESGNHDAMFFDTYYYLKMLKEYQVFGTIEELNKMKKEIRILAFGA